MTKRKIIKAKYGVEIQEDTKTGRLFMLLDGFSVFTSGIPKELSKLVDKSFENIVEIRKKDGYDQNPN